MVIQEAAEMYLETILVVQKRAGHVRAVDIANEMGYSRPTVSEQMKRFRENGYKPIPYDFKPVEHEFTAGEQALLDEHAALNSAGPSSIVGNHSVIGYEKILSVGFEGMADEVRRQSAKNGGGSTDRNTTMSQRCGSPVRKKTRFRKGTRTP